MDPLVKTEAYKMVILGHYSVGKSSVAMSFVRGGFNPAEESTIGASFLTKTIFKEQRAIRFEIWDTAGQERYYSLIPMYYRGAQIALIVYDATSAESFRTAKKWVEELKFDKPSNFIKALIANKIDLRDQIAVTSEEGREYAKAEKLLYFETSAKTGEGIHKLFDKIAEALPHTPSKKVERLKLKKRSTKLFCC
ncbi:hypothetical protein ENBRE01_2005 [Enteropsectra breve]|nr:hypothetical protein ENBRE01_2005 [Enteropsectra breve]